MTAAKQAIDTNPFVGPRALGPGEVIHGREREIRRLTHLLVAERIVLLYSPSGAGKTSLIEAGLIPKLRQRRFQVSPVIRVSHLPTEQAASQNRYLASTLQALEAGLRPDDQRPLADLLARGLEGYLRDWATQDHQGPGNEFLIFDQFEEILVLDPGDTEVKRAFFRELGAVLEERGRWALVSMREDYIAGLDPYLPELPTRLHTRMRLDLLAPEAALRAVRMPAAAAGRPFQDAAADRLVHDLRLVQAQRAGEVIQVPGPFVEPLQLQVVCRRLWDALPDNAKQITETDVERFARVDAALGEYYAEEVRQVADESGVPERAIREWFGQELITDLGVRRQLQRGPGSDGTAADTAVRLLEDAHLIRGEARRGSRWLELAHDQLVQPLQADNAEWFREHLSTAQHQAQQWAAHNRSVDFLLTGNSLVQAKRWAAENLTELTELETGFLAASTEVDADRRRRRHISVALRWLSAMLAVALVVAGYQWIAAAKAKNEADLRAREAASQALAAEAAAAGEDDPLLAVHDAERALRQADTVEAQAALRTAMSQDPATAVLPHGGTVTSIAFTPDGDRVLTSSVDRTVLLWDVRTNIQPNVKQYDGAVRDAQMSADGRAIAALDETGIVTVWFPDEPKRPDTRITGIKKPPMTVSPDLPMALSRDGSRVAAVDSETNTVRVFDTASGRDALPPLADHGGSAVRSIVFSPDRGLVAVASMDGRAVVYDAATGGQLAVLEGHQSGAVRVAFREDSSAIATGDGQGTVRIWTWPKPGDPIVLAGQEHGQALVMFDPEGRLLAYGDKTSRLFDSTTGDLVREFDGHGSWVIDARFTPDGRRLVTASVDGTARVWDVPSGREVAHLRHGDGVYRAALNPSGDVVATAAGTSMRLFRLAEQQLLPTDTTDWMLDALYLPDGRTVAAAGQDHQVTIWDVESGDVVARLKGPPVPIQRIDVDRSGTYVSAATEDGTVWVWDWRKRTVVAQRKLMSSALDVHFDPSGEVLVVAGTQVLAWRWRTGDEPREFYNTLGYAATFSPDGQYIAVAQGSNVEVWRADGTLPERTMFGHNGEVTNLAFSPDSARLVSTALDGTARIWRVQDGELLLTLEPRQGAVAAAAFDDGGHRVVTGGLSGAISVWDADNGLPLAMLARHTNYVNNVQFSSGPDPRILSASDDSTVRISDCGPCQPLEQVRARAAELLSADGRTTPQTAVGQCYSQFLPHRQPVKCDTNHRDEVFALLTYPAAEDDPFPGTSLNDWAPHECKGDVYRQYRGMAYDDDPDYDAWWWGPGADEWDMGQRSVVCVLTPADYNDRSQSARQPN